MKIRKLLSAVMTFAVMAAAPDYMTAKAAEEYISGENDIFKYRAYQDHVELTMCKDIKAEVEVPSEIDGLPVTVIYTRAFSYNELLADAVIHEGVIEIQDSAFYECRSLKRAVLPESLQKLDEWAFAWCTSLESINIPAGVDNIDDYVFTSCNSLNDIEIANGVASISRGAFSYCTSLTDIVLPESVSSIGEIAFECCPSLDNIVILNPECEIYDSPSTISNPISINADYSGLICGFSGSTAQAYAEKYGYAFKAIDNIGDVNLDGAVDALDASLVLTEYAASATGKPSVLDDAAKLNADVNSDGTVDALDASYILSYYAFRATGGSGNILEFIE